MEDSSNSLYLIDSEDPSALVSSYMERREVLVEWIGEKVDAMPEKMDADEIGQYVKKLQISGNLHEDIHLATRFLMGEVARRVREQTEYGDVEDTLKELVDRFGLGHIETLRRCIRTAETFHGNATLFGKWLIAGDKKRWRDFVEAGKAEVDPTALSPEAFDRWLRNEIKGVEKAAERAKKAADTIDPEDEDKVREMEGVVIMLTQEAERLRRKGRRIQKQQGTESDEALEAYEDWLHSMPCLACGTMGQTEAEHPAPSVTAKKQSDWLRVPLCQECHRLIHQTGGGYQKFKEETGHDIRELAARTLHMWITGEDCRFVAGLD